MDKKTIIDFAVKLNSNVRDVFVLNEVENKSVEDISKDLGIELSETRKRLKQAKKWFKRVLPEMRLKKKLKEKPEDVYIVLRGDYEWERYNYNPNMSDGEIISDAEHFFNEYSKKELHHSVLDIVFDDPEWSVIYECPNDTTKTARANGKFTFDIHQQFVSYKTTMTKDELLDDFKQQFSRSQSYFVDDGFYFKFSDEDIQMDPIIDDQGYIVSDNQKLMEARLTKALSKTMNFKEGDIVMVNPEYYKDFKPVIVNDVIKQSVDENGKPYGIIMRKHINPNQTKPVSYDVKFFLGPNDEYTYGIFPFMLLPRENVNIDSIIDNIGSMNEARLKKSMKDIVDIPLSDEYKDETISRATLLPEDLAYAFKKFIEHHIGNYSSNNRKNFEELSQEVANLENKSNAGTLTEDDMEQYNYIVDELIGMLNMIAPDGTYFGSHPGDGSDFGFWKHENDDYWDGEFVHEPEDLTEARLKKRFKPIKIQLFNDFERYYTISVLRLRRPEDKKYMVMYKNHIFPIYTVIKKGNEETKKLNKIDKISEKLISKYRLTQVEYEKYLYDWIKNFINSNKFSWDEIYGDLSQHLSGSFDRLLELCEMFNVSSVPDPDNEDEFDYIATIENLVDYFYENQDIYRNLENGELIQEARLRKSFKLSPRNILIGNKAKDIFNYILDYNAKHGTWPEDKIGYVGYYKDGDWWVAWDNTGEEPFEENFDTEEKAKMWVMGEFDIFDNCPECGGGGCQICKGTGYRLNQQSSNKFQPRFDNLREARLKKQLKSCLDVNGQEIMIGDDIEVGEPRIFDLWNNTFVGTVVDISYDDGFVTVRDQEDMYYEVPTSQVEII